jgi:RNA polymerase sigma-70 factor, ECF subfamily
MFSETPLTRSSAELDSDGQIVCRLKERDGSAMLALYDRYGRLLFSIIYRAVREHALAEELVQDSLLRAWTRVQTFDGEKGSLSGWLATIARHRAVDHLRSSRYEPRFFADLDEVDRLGLCPTEPGGDRIERARAVTQALSRLNVRQREVIELTYFEGMTQTEVAQRLNKPLGTVKGLVRSALKMLRTTIDPPGRTGPYPAIAYFRLP